MILIKIIKYIEKLKLSQLTKAILTFLINHYVK